MIIIHAVSSLVFFSIACASPAPVTCSSPGVECEYNEQNYIDTESQVPSEEECRSICDDQDQCQFITYFNSSASPFSNICRSLKTCDSVIPCENCVSEKVDCYKKPCSFNMIGINKFHAAYSYLSFVTIFLSSSQKLRNACF